MAPFHPTDRIRVRSGMGQLQPVTCAARVAAQCRKPPPPQGYDCQPAPGVRGVVPRAQLGKRRVSDLPLPADVVTPDHDMVIHSVLSSWKSTKDRTTTFLRHGASIGTVGSIQAVWKDQGETDPAAT